MTNAVGIKGAKPVKNVFGNTPLHSEAMHCDAQSVWPTEIANALVDAFPDLATEVNKNELTSQQTFEQGIDSEDPATEKKTAKQEAAAVESQESTDAYRDNAAAARAGTRCHLKISVMHAANRCLR